MADRHDWPHLLTQVTLSSVTSGTDIIILVSAARLPLTTVTRQAYSLVVVGSFNGMLESDYNPNWSRLRPLSISVSLTLGGVSNRSTFDEAKLCAYLVQESSATACYVSSIATITASHRRSLLDVKLNVTTVLTVADDSSGQRAALAQSFKDTAAWNVKLGVGRDAWRCRFIARSSLGPWGSLPQAARVLIVFAAARAAPRRPWALCCQNQVQAT